MKLCFNVAELEKAFGKKDISRLTQKLITDKNGHQRKVYVKTADLEKMKRQVAGGNAAVAEGDTIKFRANGEEFSGIVVVKGKDGVTVNGTGRSQGIQYRVPYSDIAKIEKPVNSSDKIRFLMDANSVEAGWRGTNGYQPKSCDTIDGLLKTVEAAKGEFSDISEGVKKQFASLNPILLKRKTLKSVDRIKEKLREDEKAIKKDYVKAGRENEYKPSLYDEKTDTYHCRTIRDCDGHTFCMKSVDDVEKLLQYFNKQPYVVRVKNNFAKPSKVGYSDININIKLSNDVIVEMQLNTTANMVAKERYGHSLYEVYRAIESNPKYKQLADIMGEAQKKLYRMSNEYSVKGNYPNDVPGGNIYAEEYKHEPYAKAIRDYVNMAMPMFREAVANGAFNTATVKHFQHLLEYIR